MMEIEKTRLGEAKCPDSSNLSSSNSLGLESFWGLFMIVGVAGVLALIIYVVRFLYKNWHDVHRSNAEATLGSKALELFRRFNNRDLTSHTFKNTGPRENHKSCGCDCVRRVMESSEEHFESHPSPTTLSHNSPGNNGPPIASPVSSSSEAHFREEHEGEESNGTEHEIELVRPTQDKQLASTSANLADG